MIPKVAREPGRSSWGERLWWAHEADVGGAALKVSNELVGSCADADLLRGLLQEERIKWTAEVRCPRSAFSHTATSVAKLWDIDLNLPPYTRAPSSNRFLFCGLAAAQPLTLNLRDVLPIYPDVVDVKQGQWLCHEVVLYQIEQPLRSLLAWKPDDSLDAGHLKVARTGQLRYTATVSPKVHAQIKKHQRPDLQVAALVSIMSAMRTDAVKSATELEDNPDEAVPSPEYEYLKRYGISIEDPFDAAAAATSIVPLKELSSATAEDDD